MFSLYNVVYYFITRIKINFIHLLHSLHRPRNSWRNVAKFNFYKGYRLRMVKGVGLADKCQYAEWSFNSASGRSKNVWRLLTTTIIRLIYSFLIYLCTWERAILSFEMRTHFAHARCTIYVSEFRSVDRCFMCWLLNLLSIFMNLLMWRFRKIFFIQSLHHYYMLTSNTWSRNHQRRHSWRRAHIQTEPTHCSGRKATMTAVIQQTQ